MNFTQTIKDKTKAEIIEIIESSRENSTVKNFDISRKINQFIFFDDTNQQICLPNHKKYAKENLKPEVYSYGEILGCQVITNQTEGTIKKKKQKLGCIKVTLTMKSEKRDIWLVPNLINVESMAYKTMSSLANSIVDEVNYSKKFIVCQ
ncbi:hypothetical protein [Enterococcus faecium]|nr:hypothetical protein [Enterococcus faecium]ELB05494.1 hypothetical protein OIG_04375 [Enterococcus faecium EnGen0028]MDT6323795.1 hypothetical protein [Enterococcus faecium]